MWIAVNVSVYITVFWAPGIESADTRDMAKKKEILNDAFIA